MTKEELENYADKYLTERFGAKTGNDFVRQALLDGYSLALSIHDVVGRSEELKCLDCGSTYIKIEYDGHYKTCISCNKRW